MRKKGDFLMKSFCIKNNNNLILDYLLTEFEKIDLENNIVLEVKHYEDGRYEVITKNFGTIICYKARELFNDDKEVMKKIEEYFLSMKCEYVLIDIFAYNHNAINFYKRGGDRKSVV